MSKATSIDAYRNLSQTNHFSYLQVVILDNIKMYGPATRKELALRIAKPINSVCDPVLRLIEAGKLIETEVVDPENNRRVNQLSIPGRRWAAKAQSKPTAPVQGTNNDPVMNLDTPYNSLTTTPTNKELLCSSILQAQFTRVDDDFVAQVTCGKVIFLVKLTPVSIVGA